MENMNQQPYIGIPGSLGVVGGQGDGKVTFTPNRAEDAKVLRDLSGSRECILLGPQNVAEHETASRR